MMRVTWCCGRPLCSSARLEHGGELRHRLGERTADELGALEAKQLLRRAVGKRDAVVAIEADDAGRHAGEHRLHEAAPLGELGVGGDEVGALALQLLGHGVEIHRQAAQIALAAADRQLDLQVAFGDVLGGADQPPDRRDEAAGKPDPDPDRRQQRGERDHEVHHAVRELEAAPDLAQAFVGAHAGFRAPQVLHHLRIDAAGDVEIGVRIAAKLGQRRHAEGVASASAAAPVRPRRRGSDARAGRRRGSSRPRAQPPSPRLWRRPRRRQAGRAGRPGRASARETCARRWPRPAPHRRGPWPC